MADKIVAVIMPKWGLSMTEGTLVEWNVEPGASVTVGDEIASIETSKISGPLEATASGVFQRQVAGIGATLPVGGLLGIIAAPETEDAALDVFIAEYLENFVPEEAQEKSEKSELERVEVDGQLIAYQRVPAQQKTSAAPILLIHGFGGDSESWLMNLDVLTARREAILMDLPSHGRSSPHVRVGSVEALANTVVGLLDAIGVQQLHLLGHSLGGAIALHIALEQPNRIASLTTLASCGYGDYINMEFIEGFIAANRRKEMKANHQLLFTSPEFVTRQMVEDALKHKRIDGVVKSLQTIATAAFHEGKQTANYRDRLHELSMPTLAIWGAQDQIVSPNDAQDLPGSLEVHVLDTVGHIPHVEAAPEVNKLVTQHLDA